MTNPNAIRILNVLYAGFSVTLKGYEYYLCTDNGLGIKMQEQINGKFIPRVDQDGYPILHSVDWSLKDFLTVCDRLSAEEVNLICAEAERQIANVQSNNTKTDKGYTVGAGERRYKIESHSYLFKYAGFLGRKIESLNGIIQNDNLIPLSELKRWVEDINKYTHKLLDYASSVVNYVKYGKEPTVDQDMPSQEDIPNAHWSDDEIPF